MLTSGGLLCRSNNRKNLWWEEMLSTLGLALGNESLVEKWRIPSTESSVWVDGHTESAQDQPLTEHRCDEEVLAADYCLLGEEPSIRPDECRSKLTSSKDIQMVAGRDWEHKAEVEEARAMWSSGVGSRWGMMLIQHCSIYFVVSMCKEMYHRSGT